MAGKYKEPQICVFNNTEIAQKLDEEYVVETCDLGVIKEIEYGKYENERYLNIDYHMIPNLHEYKVLVIDLQQKGETRESKSNEEPRDKSLFKVQYPKKIFNPTPFVLERIGENANKDCLKVIFATESYVESYFIVEIYGKGNIGYREKFTIGSLNIISASTNNKTGKKICAESNPLANLISKYTRGYQVVFELPTVWNAEKGVREPDKNYIPLLKNQEGEVISYIGYDRSSGYELILPECDNKPELISTLFSQDLPEKLPNLFPESRTFEWINNAEYVPVEYTNHLAEKKRVQEEYEAKLDELSGVGEEIIKKYQFLNNILIETGDKLVEAVCEYLRWLGFDDVIEMDGKDDIFREDIQIVDGDRLFIIEVKGIGGTSTDAECAQVAKHRRKREKENRDKEILPIYIVNHQRYINPSQRQNPPFSKDQIDYAKNDERGLLTTWQLYRQFKLIEQGIFTKEETRESLDEIGLVSLIPKSLVSLGVFNEYYKKNNAGILCLNNCEISIGKEVYAHKEDTWICTKIISLQLNNTDVENVKDGEVGIATEHELGKGYEIFVKI